MFNLVMNENMKIYRRLRTWIMLALLVVGIILIAVVLVTHQHASAGGWQHGLRAQIAQYQQVLKHPNPKFPLTKAGIANIKSHIAIDQYHLAHNIDPNLTTGVGFAATAENLSTLLIAFILVIAGDIMASEFASGAIKMLLTQTATRTKIFFSKFIAVLIFSLFATALMFVASLVVGFIFFGPHGAQSPHVFLNAKQQVVQMTALSYLLMQYGFLLVQIVITATIALMISSIFRSSALAIIISLLAYMVGSTLVAVLSRYHWVKYILFANTDLSKFVVGGPSIKGMTLGFSVTMLIAYFIVMMGLAWVVFLRRDVAYT
ncbi:ABC transporter permease [Alicyclobacillus sp. ALC3]|uniref:ABC transporter permease n=1 Tax=Alicyclobacillus sp. ALC3 TaxID=2796143 RepID=UPI002378A6D6|nr:ABC transporter permease [Alicyclobacillus sp. ALC3]WDL98253.1 ABC transporter permease [Alicyclobacillus sp. ALC3]